VDAEEHLYIELPLHVSDAYICIANLLLRKFQSISAAKGENITWHLAERERERERGKEIRMLKRKASPVHVERTGWACSSSSAKRFCSCSA